MCSHKSEQIPADVERILVSSSGSRINADTISRSCTGGWASRNKGSTPQGAVDIHHFVWFSQNVAFTVIFSCWLLLAFCRMLIKFGWTCTNLIFERIWVFQAKKRRRSCVFFLQRPCSHDWQPLHTFASQICWLRSDVETSKKLSVPVAALFDVFFFATGILGQALAPSWTGDVFFFLNLSSKQWLSHDSIGLSKQLPLDLSQGRCYSAACAANSFWPWRSHPTPALLSLYHIIRACWTSYLVPVSHLKCEKPIWHVTKTKISAWRKWHRHIGLKFHGKIC